MRGLAKGICQKRARRILPQAAWSTDFTSSFWLCSSDVSDGSEVSFSSCYFLMVVNAASACRELIQVWWGRWDVQKGLGIGTGGLANCTVGPVSFRNAFGRKDPSLKEGLQKAIERYILRKSQRNFWSRCVFCWHGLLWANVWERNCFGHLITTFSRVMVLRMNVVAGDGCEVWRVAMLRKVMQSLICTLCLHSLPLLIRCLICKCWKLWVAAVQCPTMWNDGKFPSDSCLRHNFSLEICLKFEVCLKILKYVWSLSGLLQPRAPVALLDAYFQAPTLLWPVVSQAHNQFSRECAEHTNYIVQLVKGSLWPHICRAFFHIFPSSVPYWTNR